MRELNPNTSHYFLPKRQSFPRVLLKGEPVSFLLTLDKQTNKQNNVPNKTFAPTTDIIQSQQLSETKMLNHTVKSEHMPTHWCCHLVLQVFIRACTLTF